MLVPVISSLDIFSRQKARAALATESPDVIVIVIFHDLLETGVVIRRTFRNGLFLEREESTLEHGCLSCTVRLDVVPAVARQGASGSRIIAGLPPAVASSMAEHALLKGLGDSLTIDAVVLTCAPDALEDQIWDHRTLFESDFTPVPADERTAGEFLLGELYFNDTVILAESTLIPVDMAARTRGVQLIKELAPHAAVTDSNGPMIQGQHHLAEAMARITPGSVRAPARSSAPFTTVIQRSPRPLHPGRFRHALAAITEGSRWLRGRIWVASAPGCRIAVQGIGPRGWLENTGPWLADREPHRSLRLGDPDAALDWHPEFGGRGTVLAVTGDDVDAGEIAALLKDCELTEAEMASGATSLGDPFDLNQATETQLRRNS